MINKNFCLLLILLMPAVGSVALAARHAPPKPSAACADPAQPARLQCALAPSAGFDDAGRLWVAWSYGGHVYVSQSADSGKTFNAPVSVNRVPEAIAARGENRPKVVVDKNGRVYVSWVTPLQKPYSGHVRFSYSADGGVHFSEPVTVNDNLDITSHRFEAMQVNERGEVYLAWLDKRDRVAAEKQQKKYRGAAVYFTLSEDGGVSFMPNRKIIDNSCECCRVAMAMNSSQLPVILWRNIYGKDVRDHALVEFVDRLTPGKVERVSTDEWHIDACPHHGPGLSISESGDQHLVWFNNATQSHGLFYARREQATGTLTPAINFGNYAATASHPDVLARGDSVWLTWIEFDGQNNSVWLQYSADRGDHWAPAVNMASTPGDADYPFLLADREQVYIQWQTSEQGFRLLPVAVDE